MIDEKLFLSKSNNVFIDEATTAKLKQFQIDGLRFIYTQYRKGEPGIIINDPPRSGRSTQIIIFLNVIKSTLEQPALILCDNVANFRRFFHLWIEDCSDVIFNSQKTFVNKKIFINNIEDLDSVSRREWSIVIVYNDDCSEKMMKQLNCLKTAFKIVVVTKKLKNNISKFFTIYDWICPKHNISIEDFLPKDQTVTEFVDKAILVDYLFEHKVLCRNNIGVIKETQTYEKNDNFETAAPKVSRKNKDPTGTKVKRSNKNIGINTVDDEIEKNINKGTSTSMVIVNNNDCVENILTDTTLEDQNDASYAYLTKKKRKRTLVIESDSDDDQSKKSHVKTKTIPEIDVDIFIKSNVSVKNKSSVINSKSINDAIINENKDLVKIINKDANETQIEVEEVKLVIGEKSKDEFINNSDTSHNSIALNEKLFSNEQVNKINNLNKFDTNNKDVNETGTKITEEKINEIDVRSKDEFIFNTNTSHNDVNITTNEDLFSNEQMYKMNNLNKFTNDKINNGSLIIKTNICDKNNENCKVESDIKCETDKSFDETNNTMFEEKMKEHEKDAMKKFKGSFLDSIL